MPQYDRNPEKRLGISALLHYLWDQAQLNKSDPKSSATLDWKAVSDRLLLAAANNNASGWELGDILYVPRGGSNESTRLSEFMSRVNNSAKRQKKKLPRMLIISEFKNFSAENVTDYHDPHTTVWFKQGINFPIDERYAPSAGYDFYHPEIMSTIFRKFKKEIELLRKHKGSSLILIATFGDQPLFRASAASRQVLHDIGGMLVDANWLPFEDENQKQLLDELRRQRRDFWVTLRFNLPAECAASGILFDRYTSRNRDVHRIWQY